jgi:hypothetical protein
LYYSRLSKKTKRNPLRIIQAASSVPDMFCNSHLVKNHRIANKMATAQARGKMSTELEVIEYFYVFDLIQEQ